MHTRTRPFLPRTFLALALGCTLTSGADADPVRSFAGFTRPGIPNDTVQQSEVIAVSTDQKKSQHALGGTVYFMVFEKSGDNPKDPWNTGIPDFMDHFNAGVDFGGKASPMLDPKAQYLYLYQTVNDRGTGAPIRSTSFELHADLKEREITSWGEFDKVTFVAPLKSQPTIIRPVSLGHNVAHGGVEQKVFRDKNQAFTGTDELSLQRLAGNDSEKPMKDPGGLLKLVWEELNPPVRPDYVMLLASKADQRPTFRGIWSEEHALKKGRRSTVFGFTSNQKPRMGTVRLESMMPKKTAEEEGIAFAADGEDKELILVAATGQAVTPEPKNPPPPIQKASFPPEKKPVDKSVPSGGIVNPTIVGGPLITPSQSNSPSQGVAPSVLGGGGQNQGSQSGGGIGGGSGGGNGRGASSTGAQSQTSTGGSQSSTQSVMQSVQIAIEQNNSNRNRNSNSNRNRNNNSNRNCNNNSSGGGSMGEVVPAPASMLLALLGLPVLCLVARRYRLQP